MGDLKGQLSTRLQSLKSGLREEEESATWGEYLRYKMEKLMSRNSAAVFYMLFTAILVLSLVLGATWWGKQGSDIIRINELGPDAKEYEQYTFIYAVFIAFQMLTTGDYNDSVDGAIGVVTYILMLFIGLLAGSILIGIITEAFVSLTDTIKGGELRVVEKDHTLILGWNESTVRVVCQLAFVRRQWQQLNEVWYRRLFWWLRVEPSTPVAKGAIVILCTEKTKQEMEDAIRHAFVDRGIKNRRTRVGCDVICRQGNPCNIADLESVSAAKAAAIVIHHIDGDHMQAKTVRALLAVRFVLFACCLEPHPKLRVVVEMSKDDPVVDAATFAVPARALPAVHLIDVNSQMNKLLFSCIGQQGISTALQEILDFESVSIKFRNARNFTGMVGCEVEKMRYRWEDAVFLGVQTADFWTQANQGRSRDDPDFWQVSGLLPPKDYVIEEGDRLVFLCRSSMPKEVREGIPAATSGKNAEEATDTASSHRVAKLQTSYVRHQTVVLVCGWPDAWDNAKAFMDALEVMLPNNKGGLKLHFLCARDEQKVEECRQLMKDMQVLDVNGSVEEVPGSEAVPGTAWIFHLLCTIFFEQADPSEPDTLRRVLEEQKYGEYTNAIVIPPRSSKHEEYKDAEQCDNWSLRVILMIETLAPGLKHIVVENAQDVTAQLVAVPSGKRKEAEDEGGREDFVNAQAIKARAICQVVVYPAFGPVLADMYSTERKGTTMLMVGASVFGVHGRMTFKQVRQNVASLGPGSGRDVCIGFRTESGKLELPPMLSQPHEFQGNEKLIVLSRHAMSVEEFEDGPTT